MPHKHTRRADDGANFNLPPSIKARPLPVGKQAQSVFTFDDEKRQNKKRKRARGHADDDTPRAFARLMQRVETGRPPRSGLDDGVRPAKKKQKKQLPPASVSPAADSNSVMPKILPNESLSDFAARVNQALPIAGISRKGSKTAQRQQRQTRTEKKLQKGYAAWRADEARIREREEEARERAEEEEEEQRALDGLANADADDINPSKRRRRLIGEVAPARNSKADDPWAELWDKREKPAGLHDLALAPPQFTKLPREKFKVINAGSDAGDRRGAKSSTTVARPATMALVHNVPSAGKSLKQREALGEARQEIIERYRAIMAESRK